MNDRLCNRMIVYIHDVRHDKIFNKKVENADGADKRGHLLKDVERSDTV